MVRSIVISILATMCFGSSGCDEAETSPIQEPDVALDLGSDADTSQEMDLEVDVPPIETPFEPPYDLPAPGQVVLIGTNTAMDIIPEGMTQGGWDYSLFNSYGGGTFVEDFSQGGAYVLAGTGGHNHPRNPGAAIFDFEDATWKRIDPSNGADFSDSDYRLEALNGSPFYEVEGTTVPSPPHPYQTLCAVPERLGGGPKGSVIYVTRSAIAAESASSTAVHQFDLATGAWTRRTESLAVTSQPESSALFDAQRNVYWFAPYGLHNYRTAHYLDATDWTFKTLGEFPDWPSGLIASGRVFMHTWGAGSAVVRQGDEGSLWAFNPDTADLGWQRLTVVGELPGNGDVFSSGGDGRYYWMSKMGGNDLVRLTPPEDPFEGAWQVDTISLEGPPMPERTRTSGHLNHYTGLFWVPSVKALAWISGGENPVALWRPPL